MSLIERAAARLTESQPTSSGPRDDPAWTAPESEQRTSIERLADRMAGNPSQAPSVSTDPAAPDDATLHATSARIADRVQPTGRPHSVGRLDIDLDMIRSRGMVVPDGPATPSSHEFRVIKRPLLGNAFGRSGQAPVANGRRIMVTSAFPGEGKSFCALNLAMSIAAERDHGVILIDADVARPSIPRMLGISNQAGMMEWLLGEQKDLSQLVLSTNVDALSILPAGRRHENATELLASEAMGALLNELSRLYPDCVFVFDSPPLLVTTEARVLASHLGQIVMVVEAGKTPRDAVNQALSTIESNEIIGLVLNKANMLETNGYYQQYGYGAT